MLHHWIAQARLSKHIARMGSIEAYVRTLPHLHRAVVVSRTLYCIDEGVPGGHCAPGSLVGLPKEKQEAFIRRGGIERITSHHHCAAVRAWLRNNPSHYPNADPNWVAPQVTAQIAVSLQVEYAGHISTLHRPPEQHATCFIYYVDMGGQMGFEPAEVPGLSRGFVISRGCHDLEDALNDTRFAHTTIRSHGRDVIGPRVPVHLVAVATCPRTLAKRQEELTSAFGQEKDMKIDGFRITR